MGFSAGLRNGLLKGIASSLIRQQMRSQTLEDQQRLFQHQEQLQRQKDTADAAQEAAKQAARQQIAEQRIAATLQIAKEKGANALQLKQIETRLRLVLAAGAGNLGEDAVGPTADWAIGDVMGAGGATPAAPLLQPRPEMQPGFQTAPQGPLAGAFGLPAPPVPQVPQTPGMGLVGAPAGIPAAGPALPSPLGPLAAQRIRKTANEADLAKVRIGEVHARIEHLATQDQSLLQNMDMVKARINNVLLKNRFLPYDEQLKGYKAETDRLLAQHLINHQSYQDLLSWARDRNSAFFRAAEIGVQGYNAQTGRMNAMTAQDRQASYAARVANLNNGKPVSAMDIQKELTRVEGEKQKRSQFTDPITGRVKENPLGMTDDLDAYAEYLRGQLAGAKSSPAQPVGGGGMSVLPPNAGAPRSAQQMPGATNALPDAVRQAMEQSYKSGRPWHVIARDMARMPQAVAYAVRRGAEEKQRGVKQPAFDQGDVAAIRRKLSQGWSAAKVRDWYRQHFKSEYQVADAILQSMGK